MTLPGGLNELANPIFIGVVWAAAGSVVDAHANRKVAVVNRKSFFITLILWL
ncbi:hypothetical protein V5F77_12480 [Xanthobacter sp. DSM 24535]|uniref:hypothetical protein n=1 Tax=Roseixanthobacter psychrophilus TaxID=3119917 RepID=UPI00372BF4C9